MCSFQTSCKNIWHIFSFTYAGKRECSEAHALGMESRAIKNDQITASSSFYSQNNAWDARLNNVKYWAAATRHPSDPWIQVDLSCSTIVTGIITQGSADEYDEWITHLQIQYGDSEDSLVYILENGQEKVSKK